MLSSSSIKPRPRSPHLTIYKPQLTSVLSVGHRLSGIGLAFGAIIFVLWLAALAGGADAYAAFTGYAQSILGQIILLGLSAAFLYHICSGIRHLLWDAGYFLEIKDVYKTGKIMMAVVVLLLLFVWMKAYGVSL